MTALYVVNHAVVRFWETRHPSAAVARLGDIEVACADCIIARHGLPLTQPGILRLLAKEVSSHTPNICKWCGTTDTTLTPPRQSLVRRLLKW